MVAKSLQAASLLAALLWSAQARAELRLFVTPAGTDPVVYDDVSGLAWYRDMSDASPFSGRTYAEQLDRAANLNAENARYHGLAGWHIANEVELRTLLENPLSDVAWAFDSRCFGSTCVAMGRYENVTHPPPPEHHYLFNVTKLSCCEPYDLTAGGYGGFPYTELIQYPGTGNDILVYAVPVPALGGPARPPDANSAEGAWVVTGNVTVTPEGTLVTAQADQQPSKCPAIPKDVAAYPAVVRALYDSAKFSSGAQPDWSRLCSLFHQQARIRIPEGGQVMGRDQVIQAAKRLLRAWKVSALDGGQVSSTSLSAGGLAMVRSRFELVFPAESLAPGPAGRAKRYRGTLAILLVQERGRWWILSLASSSTAPARTVRVTRPAAP